MLQLALAIEALLGDGCALVVVRAKDRFNNPTSFGYTDFLLNVRLTDGRHVGELQLHLEAIHAIKPACHRTYAIMRQVSLFYDPHASTHPFRKPADFDLHSLARLAGRTLSSRATTTGPTRATETSRKRKDMLILCSRRSQTPRGTYH